MNLKAEILKANLHMFTLEAKAANENLSMTISDIVESFPAFDPEAQAVIIDTFDEMAQEAMRKRDMFDTALAAMKKVQDQTNE